MVARLTSDMDSISELVDGGIDDLVLAGLSVVSVTVVLLVLDPPLAIVTLLSFPFLLWLSRWFAKASTLAYRRTREAVALVIVHFVESLGGIRAVPAFRREPRNRRSSTRSTTTTAGPNCARSGSSPSTPRDQADRQRHDRGRPTYGGYR